MRICIDPGHGGKDPGAVSNGLKEKDITLSIALETARLLRAAGQTVILTRETDRFIDLTQERAPAADISVSIHVNAGGGYGLETWVSAFHHVKESRQLGQAIQDSILKRIQFRDRGIKSKANSSGTDDYLYMLRKPKGVAVLVECGFIDSTTDAAFLRSADKLKQIAQGIASGILQYLAKGVIDVALDKWMIDGGRDALAYLEKKGLVLNAADWGKEEKLAAPTPQYLFWMLMQRMAERTEGK